MESRELLKLAVARFEFLTLNEKLKLYRAACDVEWLRTLRPAGLERLIERRLRTGRFDPSAALERAEGDRKLLTRKRIQYTFYEDTDYPPQLREIHDPPFLLFFRGKLPDYDRPMLGIVGTRHPTGSAENAAFELGYEAARSGVSVVSGLARGIDGCAHAGSVAGGGRTVAVLGCGIDFVYPAENRQLAVRMLKAGGALVSEYPPGEPPLRHHFPARNRILSGLCRGIVVVEAPAKSGALITVDHALDQGRDLFVHRRGLGGMVGSGTRRLAEEGAMVVDGMGEILSEWDVEAGSTTEAAEASLAPSDLAARMRAELNGELVNHRGRYFRRVWNG